MTEPQEQQQTLGEIGLENFAPYLMNRIMGRYNASMREELAELGLTTPKMRALAVLAMIDGLLIGQLAVYAVVEYSTLSRSLDGLEADALVERRPDIEDARATRVFITPAGRSTFEKIWPRMAEATAQMFEGISTDERRVFTTTLQKMLRNIRVHDF
ncbi:Transcriptional regulator, MarR family (plasmid) [Tritonibacter mobilis]|jgi:DNA-binding MarR family transcriptional regulator|uniref:Transcriptional regulator n=2 Tax=Paracoccaceae TaxID=31989 RepID=A0A1B1A9U3_9RHOB|nr:MarR family transcriptional regulator [Tritonibacter mobilis]MBW3245202.1 MarR family transcriptional regulator [Epibacterium sp. DP7N7-1]MCZ4269350.1 MarR family transcriptional regulator [Rhodobacteraceae bacterium G21628-S1]MEE2811359.1 MarR family transcriptional regulator [Pseudomonadota bacterium]PXW78664.1 DNA-binding MarR family transcriptional regulator [Ruegeria sp. P4]ANP43355.1 transcriptional regulator [Tritonibacter mobilis F1926]